MRFVEYLVVLVCSPLYFQGMRSAVAIYYGRHNGNFPLAPEKLVTPSPPAFQCPRFRYAYNPATGELKITSTNTVADCR